MQVFDCVSPEVSLRLSCELLTAVSQKSKPVFSSSGVTGHFSAKRFLTVSPTYQALQRRAVCLGAPGIEAFI